ncbi:hypothetical protein PY092_12440 [Muricauda sp. 334s03]|uniref:ApeA N-terminal domain-containing protein n=1 Tax=Flagellimonas yonaguniensis TaxID=3031325 RepID=A0ABT5Y0J4_9FLAO|nr:HEPN domain-containing protein [[Muricauda] yonaguniensis]MDF0716962.1 hypothetical protein [[Muricauda] yonaguniensis]
MDKPFEYKGKWFLPHQDEEEAVAGILKYRPNKGLTLELIGKFEGEDEIEIIYGVIGSGKAVTLYNSFIIKQEFMLSEMEMSTYLSNVCFIGGWFDGKSDLMFNKAKVSYAHLDDWLNISSGFNIKHDYTEFRTQIEYVLPQFKKIQVEDSFSLTINPTAKGPSRRLIQKDASIVQKIYMVFETKRKTHYDEYLKRIFHFQNFLTVATQHPIFIKELSMFFKVKGDSKRHEAKVYFQLTHIPQQKEELFPFDMILPYREIKDDFETIIKKWFGFREQLETSLHPYTSVFYAPFLYISDKFLNLSRSLEAYHRDFINGSHVSFVDRCKKVVKSNSRIYNPTLKIVSIPIFAKNIKNFRNDFTHSNPLTSRGKKYLKTHKFSEYLKVIMAVAFLVEMGVDKKILKNKINTSRLYVHMRHKLK